MDSQKHKDLAEVIKKKLIQSRKVKIPDLGSLEVHHQKQKQEQRNDGQVILNPPKDEVRFKPAARQKS